jgi:hypothetical protein
MADPSIGRYSHTRRQPTIAFMYLPKSATLLLGFLSSLLGTVGSFVLVESLNRDIKALVEVRNATTHQIESISRMNEQYFVSNQQGDLIFVLAQDRAARNDVSDLLFKGSMLDRATPVRNLLGALAVAGKLDYRQTYAVYEQFNDRARQSGQFIDYQRLKELERGLVETSSVHIAALHERLVAIGPQITQAEGALRTRQAMLITLSSFGAAVLLLANLLEARHANQTSRAIA